MISKQRKLLKTKFNHSTFYPNSTILDFDEGTDILKDENVILEDMDIDEENEIELRSKMMDEKIPAWYQSPFCVEFLAAKLIFFGHFPPCLQLAMEIMLMGIYIMLMLTMVMAMEMVVIW